MQCSAPTPPERPRRPGPTAPAGRTPRRPARRAPDRERRIEAVRGVLQEIGSGAQELLVFNQIDKLEQDEVDRLLRDHEGVAVSALRRTGLRALLHQAEQILWAGDTERREMVGGLTGLTAE